LTDPPLFATILHDHFYTDAINLALDEIDKKIIARLQGDLPVESEPFAPLAAEVGLSQDALLERIQAMADSGVMRRFGATLRHQRSGFAANVMVAWRVPEDQADQVGETLAEFRNVSHCYHRRPCQDFPYNVFSMVHGRSEEECRRLVEEMALSVDVIDHQLLFSVEELKKTSMRYF
jgi:DNA-binding Lrp family transcriptional regulator